MINKSDIEKIRMACELRRRGYSVDIGYNPESDFFKGCISAITETLRKLQDIKYIDDYIQSKQKYMSDKEKEEWITPFQNYESNDSSYNKDLEGRKASPNSPTENFSKS